MLLNLTLQACQKDDTLPLCAGAVPGLPVHWLDHAPLPLLRVGTVLAQNNTPLFTVTGRAYLPMPNGGLEQECLWLTALCSHMAGPVQVSTSRTGWALAWITLSDKGFAGKRIDTSGPLLAEHIRNTLPLCWEQGFLIPDDKYRLQALTTDLSLSQGYDLLLTSGGTGLGPRDITPETLLPLFEKRLPGFEQAMMQQSLGITPMAAISRAVVGTLGQTLILALPGSPKAVAENMQAVLPALQHALEKLHGDLGDCGALHMPANHHAPTTDPATKVSHP